MSDNPNTALVSLIYDAALDAKRWPDAMTAVAAAVDAQLVVLEIFDPDTVLSTRVAPLTDPEYARSYREYWHKHYSNYGRTGAHPVGTVFRPNDYLDLEWFARTPYCNEWWRPMGFSGDGLNVNVATGLQPNVIAAVYKTMGHRFSPAQERTFARATAHLVRAVAIHSRLRLAELRWPSGGPTDPPGGFVVVGRDAQILLADESARRQLDSAGLLPREGYGRLASPDGAIERLIRGAARGTATPPGAGHRDYRTADGQPLRVTVIPCSEQSRTDCQWLAVDQPAAILHVAVGGDRLRARVTRLAQEHGLTAAEAAVAVEIAQGDGRAAAAERLGIREATVRSHLSAIFDKIGVRRQAELVRLLTER
jgi:DNA-binding CsgD family transcriptional regulator